MSTALAAKQAALLAKAMADDWAAQKEVGADLLAGILVEFAQEQCQDHLDTKAQEVDPLDSVDLDWDDEQALEVLEAAVAKIRRRLALAREV